MLLADRADGASHDALRAGDRGLHSSEDVEMTVQPRNL
jgi:hypothetical protein